MAQRERGAKTATKASIDDLASAKAEWGDTNWQF
jgi:hypothetical protein